jgi:NADH dehydrogenase
LLRALDGVDTVVCTAHGGHGSRSAGPRGVERRGLPHLVELAARRSIRQLVYVSSASARSDSPADLFRAKAMVEATIVASGVPYTIVRPTHLLDTWVPLLAEPLVSKGRAMIIGNGHNPVSWVAGCDVARAIAVLAIGDSNGDTVTLGGPEAVTLRHLNGCIEQALTIAPAKTAVMAPRMLQLASRLVRPFNEVMARQMRLGALLDTQPQTADAAPTWQRLGITPSTVASWLDTNLSAVAARYRRTAAPKDA